MAANPDSTLRHPSEGIEAGRDDLPKAPEVGQAVRVRNRLATVRAVEPYDTRKDGRLNIVEVEYLDDCRYPESEQLLWEVESTAIILGKTSLPALDEHGPDDPAVLRAFIDAHRWTRLNRLHEGDGIEDEPLLGVWNSAIQVHYCQLDPVIRALSMPRVSLLLCDGVGLGKTIQCGLVLEELLLRRRIRRVLVICPAMLQRQWKYELRRKFNLDFEIIDSESTFDLRRRMGIDTNPWKAYPRIITSMDYLRMPDVLDQFLQASGVGPGVEIDGRPAPHAPWDLLIVDECHHFAPQSGSRASQRTRMLREIRFLFEHRLFASATPHNGKTVCFTGLLELLDPIRFQMSPEMDDQDRANLAEIRIRRLKEDINQQSLRPPFAEQLDPEEIPVRMSDAESALFAALREYRKQGHEALAHASPAERWVGEFVYSLLTKRLLSCPYAFARTWWRHLEDSDDSHDASLFDMARLSAERAEEQAKSDDERAVLEDDAARYAGAWFRSQGRESTEPVKRVNQALESLGLGKKAAEDEAKLAALARKADSKTEALVEWIKKSLFVDGRPRDDERLLVFTEYKETLFFLEQRVLQEGFDQNSLRLLYGGMDADKFETVKSEFEDPAAAVRVLLATDAASEGINMQECCRWVFHYDVPWSPSKLQQRNGRVARHGQVRDVSTYYFRCDQEEDLAFLLKVAKKVEQVKQDLGSVERVFNAAIQRHFRGQVVAFDRVSELVDQQIAESPEQTQLSHSSPAEVADLTRRAKELLESTEARLGISPQALINVMQAAIAVEGQGSLEEIAGRPGFYRLKPPPRWEHLRFRNGLLRRSPKAPHKPSDLVATIRRAGQKTILKLGPQATPERIASAIFRFSRYDADVKTQDIGSEVPKELRQAVAEKVRQVADSVTLQWESCGNEEGQTGFFCGTVNTGSSLRFGNWEASIRLQAFSPQKKEPAVGADMGVIVDLRRGMERVVKAVLIQAKRTESPPADPMRLHDLRGQVEDMQKTTRESYGMIYADSATYMFHPDKPQQRIEVDQFFVDMIVCERGDRSRAAVAQAYDRSIVIDVTVATAGT